MSAFLLLAFPLLVATPALASDPTGTWHSEIGDLSLTRAGDDLSFTYTAVFGPTAHICEGAGVARFAGPLTGGGAAYAWTEGENRVSFEVRESGVTLLVTAGIAPFCGAGWSGDTLTRAHVAPVVRPTNVREYYLELPADLFYCEIAPPVVDRAFKERQISYENVKSGYLLARSEDWPLQVALFKDKKRKVDVIAVNRPCGMGCMCDRFDLMQYADGAWTPWAGTFPAPEAIRKAAGIGEDEGYELVMPERGTDILVVDPETRERRLTIRWSAGEFTVGGR